MRGWDERAGGPPPCRVCLCLSYLDEDLAWAGGEVGGVEGGMGRKGESTVDGPQGSEAMHAKAKAKASSLPASFPRDGCWLLAPGSCCLWLRVPACGVSSR